MQVSQEGTRQSGGPLAGIRVVDLTSVVFGPYATQIMADMGADVIKVEPPEGDNTRWISAGPVPGMGGVYVNVNRGKRSVMLNLREEADREVLRKLVATADVFIHSMRGSAIAKLGFSYEAVKAIQPEPSVNGSVAMTAISSPASSRKAARESARLCSRSWP